MAKLPIIIAIFICGCLAEDLRLNVDGPMDGYMFEKVKKKNGLRDMGEDSLGTSPFTLAVTDGIGDTYFSTKYLSTHLVTEYHAYLLPLIRNGKCRYNNLDDFKSRLRQVMVRIVLELREKIEAMYTEWGTAKGKEPLVKRDDVHIGATMATVLINNMYTICSVRIFTRGDSQIMIWEPKPTAEGADTYLMRPTFVTPATQRQFNYPSQFRTDGTIQPADESFNHSMAGVDAELFVAATDGLWDNIHPGFLHLMINVLYLNKPKNKADLVPIEERISHYATMYTCLMESKHEALQKLLFVKKRSMRDEGVAQKKPVYAKVDPAAACLAGVAIDTAENLAAWVSSRLMSISQSTQTLIKEKKMVSDFFACPIMEMIHLQGYQMKDGTQDVPLLTKCLEKILVKNMDITFQDAANIAVRLRSPDMSGVLGRIALQFSKAQRYPSTFFLHAWQMGEFEGEIASGKEDDITVAAAALSPLKANPVELDERYFDKIKTDRAWLETDMKPNFMHMMDAINKPKQNMVVV